DREGDIGRIEPARGGELDDVRRMELHLEHALRLAGLESAAAVACVVEVDAAKDLPHRSMFRSGTHLCAAVPAVDVASSDEPDLWIEILADTYVVDLAHPEIAVVERMEAPGHAVGLAARRIRLRDEAVHLGASRKRQVRVHAPDFVVTAAVGAPIGGD